MTDRNRLDPTDYSYAARAALQQPTWVRGGRQGAFDTVWAGFAAQGWAHATDGWGRDSDGLPLPVLLDRSANRCSLGHLVTDAGVGQAVTGQSQALLQGTDAEFYRDLRKAHDETTKQGPSALRASLRDVASRYDLTVPEKE